jgi:hypothetical protein
MTRSQRRTFITTLLTLPALLCLVVAGCTIIGAAAAKLAPDPVIPPQYVPAHEPTLVLVENFHNPASLRLQADSLCRAIVDDLKVNDVAPLVDNEDAADLRHKDPEAYRKMPLDAIGKAVGATQVIYVDLESFEVTHALASELYAGAAMARVRVVGSNGEGLWPTDSAAGYPISVKVDPRHTAQGVAEDTVREQLTAALSEKIGRLFHKWTAESSDGAAEQFQTQ